MTFKEKAIDLMFSNGMFEADAKTVFETIKAAPENEAMADRWNDDIDGYPPEMINVLWFTVKRHALAYIDATCPQAWFRPMFTSEVTTG